jgi:hypothetical protein
MALVEDVGERNVEETRSSSTGELDIALKQFSFTIGVLSLVSARMSWHSLFTADKYRDNVLS